MEITQLQKFTLPVSDVDVAKSFYVDKLGFEVRAEFPVPMGKWIEVAPKGSETVFILCNWLDEAKPGSMVNTFLVTADLDRDSAELQKIGVEVNGPNEMPWGKQSEFSDPDGNTFVLTVAS